MVRTTVAEQLHTDRFELGEGAAWHEGRWLFVDLVTGRLLAHDGERGGSPEVLLALDVPLGRAMQADDGTWLLVAGTGVAVTDDLRPPDGAGGTAPDVTWVARPEDGTGRRVNDAAVDARGRVWFTAMGWDPARTNGRVHRLEPDGTTRVVVDGLGIPNGPAFGPDGDLMYLADSSAGVIWRYELDDDGDPCGRELFAREDHGAPDGMAIDVEGGVWSAVWGAGRVERRDAEGTPTDRVTLDASRPTCPALGGADGRDMLVTSAAQDCPPGTADGTLHRARAPFAGVAPNVPRPTR